MNGYRQLLGYQHSLKYRLLLMVAIDFYSIIFPLHTMEINATVICLDTNIFQKIYFVDGSFWLN